jgi:hypothetical protein
MQERTTSSESFEDGDAVELSIEHPFGPRLRRAILLFTAAVALHMGLVRGPHVGAPSQLAGAAVSQAGLIGAPAIATKKPATTTPPSVIVKTELIEVGPVGDPPATMKEVPVATTGFLRARVETPARSESDEPPVSTPREAKREAASLVASDTRAQPKIEADEPRAAVGGSAGPASASPTLALVSRNDSMPGEANGAFSIVPAVDHSAELKKDEETVRRVLLDYTRAFERLDVQATKAIWPTVDDRALQRAFQQLDGQQLRFASCGVSVSGRDANARCRGDATYRPKVGSRVLRLTEREWTFNLSRDNDRWQIVNATLQ